MADPFEDLDPLPAWRPNQSKKRPVCPVWVWPRDKGVTNRLPYSWRRFSDILKGRGPGIWVGDHRKGTPHRPTWSNWLEFDNLGYSDKKYKELYPVRGVSEAKYDFKSRKYRVPNRHTWSDVRWEAGSHPRTEVYYRNKDGREMSPYGYGPFNNPVRKETWVILPDELWQPIDDYFE